jgi:hypothetical protein
MGQHRGQHGLAVDAGHQQVEDDQVRLGGECLSQAVRPVGGGLYLVPLCFQCPPDEAQQVGFVVNDENPGHVPPRVDADSFLSPSAPNAVPSDIVFLPTRPRKTFAARLLPFAVTASQAAGLGG